MADDVIEQILRLVKTLSTKQKLQLMQGLLTRVADELGVAVLEPKPQRVLLSTDKLTYEIVGSAMAVHRTKGSGYREIPINGIWKSILPIVRYNLSPKNCSMFLIVWMADD